MKFIHIGDVHLGKQLSGYSLIEEQKYCLDQIVNYMDQADVLVIAGDVYDRAIPSVDAVGLLNDFLYALIKKGKKIIIISGNHDSLERLGFASSILSLSNIFIAKSPLEVVTIDDTNFYLAPFYSLQALRLHYGKDYVDTNEAYKDILSNLDLKGRNVLVMHDYITSGSSIELSDSERPLSIGGSMNIDYNILRNFDYVALGHIHKPQKVGCENIRYSGSILKYSFSEYLDHKSVCLISDEITLLPLTPLRDLVVIKDSINNILNMSYDDKNYYKVILTDKEEVIDAFSRIKAIFPYLCEIAINKIELKERAVSKESIKEKNYDELFQSFYKLITEDDIQETDQHLVNSLIKDVIINDN